MANKYCNLAGTDKIKDSFTDINTGFDGVETDTAANADAISGHEAETVSSGVHGMGAAAAQEYEVGSWTPTLSGTTTAGSHSYNAQNGVYTRIGDMVHVEVNIVLSSLDAAMSGSARISGLPFSSSSGNSVLYIGSLELGNVTFGTSIPTAAVIANTTHALLRLQNNSSGISSLEVGDFTNSSSIRLSMTYKI